MMNKSSIQTTFRLAAVSAAPREKPNFVCMYVCVSVPVPVPALFVYTHVTGIWAYHDTKIDVKNAHGTLCHDQSP